MLHFPGVTDGLCRLGFVDDIHSVLSVSNIGTSCEAYVGGGGGVGTEAQVRLACVGGRGEGGGG